ncbi:hypothetical protein DFH09DRAFT_1284268 [Mycena vulgaris]|nr:hypothetical protein DFH09DRAFT_1284268 [Mycena vulgaris]
MKPKGRKDCATNSSKRNPKISPVPSPHLPPELWVTIGRFVPRQALAHLSCVSHELCAVFSPLLYGDTITTPMSGAQASRLIESLSAAQPSSWKPRPATLIRHLGMTNGGPRVAQTIDPEIWEASVNALRNLAELTLGERTRGSALRVLHWHLPAGIDELGKILGFPGHFPNLKELVVFADGTNENFNIIGLEVLGISLCLPLNDEDYDSDDGAKLCYKLTEALQMLPYTSPRLHSFKLRLGIPYDEAEDTFPSLGYSDLVDAINELHFPALTTFDISVMLYPHADDDFDPDELPTTDFSTFLASHGNLVNLSLNAPDTKLTDNITFPHLRSFEGSFEHSEIITRRHRLEKLVLTFIHPFWRYNPPAFCTLPLPTHLSLTTLRVTAVTTEGWEVKRTNELSPESFAQLVPSFPNVTHLNFCTNGRMSIRVQEYRQRKVPDHWSVTEMFPAIDYIAEFRFFLPFLPHLTCIDICLLADIDRPVDSTETPRTEATEVQIWILLVGRPKLRVDYSFSVIRAFGGPKAVLDDARIRER